MKENDHAEIVKIIHNAFSVHNAFYVFMDRFHGKPNSQFLSSSGEKRSQYGRQKNRSASVTAHLRSFFNLKPFNVFALFLLGSLFKNVAIYIYIYIYIYI